jgi:hypothetical protein
MTNYARQKVYEYDKREGLGLDHERQGYNYDQREGLQNDQSMEPRVYNPSNILGV